ncbi:hypothetical protein HHI36_014815 [Cryptolaemus montrouzieri]|uniref:Uncharacterized protein n=1 Tax=Cryptolaemus montrouzieri TaxID=559131 RepID=A0ABD2N493_9CUCU
MKATPLVDSEPFPEHNIRLPLPPGPPIHFLLFPPFLPLWSSPVSLGTGEAIYPATQGPLQNLATDTCRALPRDLDAPAVNYLGGFREGVSGFPRQG